MLASEYYSKGKTHCFAQLSFILAMNPAEDSGEMAVDDSGVTDLLLTATADCLCTMPCGLMYDPVVADDDYIYERRNIEGWIKQCQSRKVEITSPRTGAPITSNLRDDADVVAAAMHKRSNTGLEGISSIQELNAVFALLDPLRDILSDSVALEEWKPPQLMVIGEESSGKSSLLERLVMMPLFPAAEGVCTRMPIHVRLRNTAQAQAPRLEVYNVAQSRTEEGPFAVPIQAVRDKVLEVLQREKTQAERVGADRIIILHVRGPHVPSLDVVDMPGLTRTAAPAGPQEKPRALIERQIAQHGAYSMYLAVVPAGQRPNTSIAMEVVQGKGLEGRTLGVFTKCDSVSLPVLESTRRLVGGAEDAAALGGIALTPHGWFATMCAPLEAREGESSSAQLVREAAAEAAFFAEHMPAAAAAGRATGGGLVRGLSGMFLEHVRTGWAPATLRRLGAALNSARRDDAALGLPALAGDDVGLARRLAAAAARRNLEAGLGEAGQACCKEVLDPMKRRLGRLVRGEWAGLRAGEAEDAWAAEAADVGAECRRAAGEWRAWWAERASKLVVMEDAAAAAGGRAAFRLERFPMYVEALREGARGAAAAAAAAVEALVGEAVDRFYSDESPWARFATDLGAAPATVGVRREAGQLVERVVQAFLRGGRAVREGLVMAAERAAGLVMDWEETCREERRGLTEKIQRIEAARAGVLRALGVAEGGEELLAGEVQRAVGLFARTRTLTTPTHYTLGTLGLVRAHAHTHNAWTSARMHPRSLASPSVSRSLARSLAPTLPPSPPPSLRPSVPFSQEPSFLPPCLPLPRCLSLSLSRPRALAPRCPR